MLLTRIGLVGNVAVVRASVGGGIVAKTAGVCAGGTSGASYAGMCAMSTCRAGCVVVCTRGVGGVLVSLRMDHLVDGLLSLVDHSRHDGCSV